MTSEYMKKQGDTFDSIAKYIYGDEKYFTNLILANYDERGTVVFSSGTILKIPTINTVEADKSAAAPWREYWNKLHVKLNWMFYTKVKISLIT